MAFSEQNERLRAVLQDKVSAALARASAWKHRAFILDDCSEGVQGCSPLLQVAEDMACETLVTAFQSEKRFWRAMRAIGEEDEARRPNDRSC